MTTLTEEEIQRNLRSVAHAIAQQELEGLNVPAAAVEDLHRVARGEIDTEEALRRAHRRLQDVSLLRQ
jgi:antitoxin VbhA-like protein